jgi:membrane protease YdiL (CAAX protease family)
MSARWRAKVAWARAAFLDRRAPGHPEATGRDLLVIVLAWAVLTAALVAAFLGIEQAVALFDPEFLFDVESDEVIFALLLAQEIVLFAGVWWRMRRRWTSAEAWGFGAFRWSFVAIGIAVGLVLTLVGHLFADSTFDVDLHGNLPYAAILFVIAAIGAPIIEEIVFRHALYGWLRHRFGIGAAIAVSSIIFGVGHFTDGWGAAAAAGVMGLALASVVQVQRTLWICVFAHATNNAIWVVALTLGWQ